MALIIGDPASFAIESSITDAYSRLSFRALGYFQIHVAGRSYGVRSPDASMLACSFDEVQERIVQRGRHRVFFAAEAGAAEIASSFRAACYAPDQEEKVFFGVSCADFGDLFYTNHLVWAPDGDEAFDDSSYVLQFDVSDRVRLIAFKASGTFPYGPDLETLSDLWLGADAFYRTLREWKDRFEAEWQSMEKTPEM